MAYRSLIIESPARLSVRRDQLIIETDLEHSVPLEDIDALLLENRQSTLTAAALSRLGESGCALFVCDERHMPCAVLQPFCSHSRASAVLDLQLGASLPLKKRLWQAITVRKIENQAACLAQQGDREGEAKLRTMAKSVRSGDTGNVEAAAAAAYFPRLFGPDFTRQGEDSRNAPLNYGYAILRGCIARELAVHGFLPSLGLHHASELNAFNLADDLIEPFRAAVDLLVAASFTENEPLTPAGKRLLFTVLQLDILSGGQHHSLSYAVARLVESLARSLRSGKCELMLPELLPLAPHRYE